MKQFTLLSIVLLSTLIAIGQTITITGQYVDKNVEPIEGASITYFTSDNMPLGSTTSNSEGNFELLLDLTRINHQSEQFIQPPIPNPFAGVCTFYVEVEGNSLLIITDLSGKRISEKKILVDGLYKCSWGGVSESGSAVRKGAYIITISSEAKSASYKVLFNGEPSQSLVVEKAHNSHLNNQKQGLVLEQDYIHFGKENTSELEVLINFPTADTSVGIITGNIGVTVVDSIEETHFSIDTPIVWNLNNYFTGDDQAFYSLEGADFIIDADVLLTLDAGEGTYSDTITATDPQDETLTAEMNVDVVLDYTVQIPTQEVDEDSEQDTLIVNLDDFKHPEYEGDLTYTLLTQSNPELINIYQDGNSILIDSLASDEWGSSEVEVEIDNGDNTEVIFFTIDVLLKIDVSGIVRNIFDSVAIAGAMIEIEEVDTTHVLYTDDDGNYYVQLSGNYDTIAYLPVTIEEDDYTPYHTWLTTDTIIGDTIMDYTLIPIDFTWDLYNDTFRTVVAGEDLGDATYHWLYPPLIHVYNDSSLCDIDITPNYLNTLANLDTILPTFNPKEALPENVVPHPEGFGYIIQDGEMGVFWNNNIGPAGTFSCHYNGPVKRKCSVIFKQGVAHNSPDDGAINQELGSVMGAITEPPQSENYTSVFADPPNSYTYTNDDYTCAHIYLSRSLLHYQNLDGYEWGDPEGWDWEQRPDIVDQWYSDTTWKANRTFHVREFDEHGNITKDIFYKQHQVPSKIMKQWPMMFSEEEIKQKQMLEWLDRE